MREQYQCGAGCNECNDLEEEANLACVFFFPPSTPFSATPEVGAPKRKRNGECDSAKPRNSRARLTSEIQNPILRNLQLTPDLRFVSGEK
jgi:hypothetical protein